MVKYFWDSREGMFFDYNFVVGKRSQYVYATTFYPLWAGLATKEQAKAIVHNLGLFEQPGGIAMSRTDSQAQWDFPYGWAPIQLLAVEGLRRYGFDSEANRISDNFLSMIVDNFRTGTYNSRKIQCSQEIVGNQYRRGICAKLHWIRVDKRCFR